MRGAVEVAELLGVPRAGVGQGGVAVDLLAALLDVEVGVGSTMSSFGQISMPPTASTRSTKPPKPIST